MVDESAVRFLQSFSGPTALSLPAAFGKYLLLHQLATGGMGTVFIARSGGLQDIQKLCVIKTLRSHFAGDQDYVVRFMDEARVVVQIDHRNICHVFDVGFCEGRYFLAMELIRGADLRALFSYYAEQGVAVPVGIALHIACEMLEALDYAHRLTDPATGEPLHLVHRDVSPQNVMASFEGEVKVIDFGLAASTLKLEQTAPQVVMGKVAYMSPEQARGEKVDRSTDLFAAAVVLYELLTGKRYYDGMSPHQIWAVVGTGEYRPPHWHLIDARLQVVLAKALHPDKGQRQADCAALRRELLDVAIDRRLRDGAPELRAVMGAAFVEEIDKQRRLVASFANLREGSVPHLTSGDQTQILDVGALEATMTASEAAVADTGETRTEKVAQPALLRVEPATVVSRPRATRAYAAAGAALFAAVLGAATFALVATEDGVPAPGGVVVSDPTPPGDATPNHANPDDANPDDAAPDDAAPDDAAPDPADPDEAAGDDPGDDEPAPSTGSGPTGNASAANPANAQPLDAPPPPDVLPGKGQPAAVEPEKKKPPKRAKPPTRGRSKHKPAVSKPKPKPPAVKKPPPPKPGATLLQNVAYLDKHCQEHRCAAQVKAKSQKLIELTSGETKALIARASQCVRVCAGD